MDVLGYLVSNYWSCGCKAAVYFNTSFVNEVGKAADEN
jgi:hypothetical protein